MLTSAVAGIADGGGAYALLAVALILMYRTTGVLNFAIAAVGTFGTFLTSVVYGHGWPLLPAEGHRLAARLCELDDRRRHVGVRGVAEDRVEHLQARDGGV